VEPPPLIQERVLYPAPRSTFAVRGSLLCVKPGPRLAAPYCSEARCRTPASILSEGRAGFPSYLVRPSLCVPSTLRGTVGGASVTTPGGAGTPQPTVHSPVLGTPASIVGSELPPLPRYGAPAVHFPRVGVPNLEHLDLSGRLRDVFTQLGS
jgi:hypothetical protein